jgi:hypothetical protein
MFRALQLLDVLPRVRLLAYIDAVLLTGSALKSTLMCDVPAHIKMK